MKKVYCCNCKNSNKRIWNGLVYSEVTCVVKTNHTQDDYYSPKHIFVENEEILMHECNIKNDCEYYKRKWYKLFK